MGSSLHQYPGDSMNYRAADDQVSNNGGQYNATSHSHHYQPHSSYNGAESEVSSDHHRVPKYTSYFHPIHGSREGPWPLAQSSSSGGDSGVPPGSSHSSHSPHFAESPTLTSSEMSFVGRFPVEEQKMPMNSLEPAPYVFPTSRSISPSSTPPSASGPPLTAPFQFTFPDSSTQDRPEFDYRRQPQPHSPEVTLHGGTADISAVPGVDAVRYRLGARRSDPGTDHPLLPVLPPLSGSDNGSQHERGSSDGEGPPYSRLRPRRSAVPSRTSRSPSPGVVPPLSGTLAVIKAQAFGALRRTRARTKKPSDGPSKVAIDVLEARGIGMGAQAGSKRQRMDDDDFDLQS